VAPPITVSLPGPMNTGHQDRSLVEQILEQAVDELGKQARASADPYTQAAGWVSGPSRTSWLSTATGRWSLISFELPEGASGI
jgi:hypothetical protein